MKKSTMADPFGKVVPLDLAIKRWRRVGKVISEELGLGPVVGWDPGILFRKANYGDGTVEFSAYVLIPLYKLCLEVRKLRRLTKVPRDKGLQTVLDERKEADRQRRAAERKQESYKKLLELHARLSDPSAEKTKGLAKRIQKLREHLYEGFRVRP